MFHRLLQKEMIVITCLFYTLLDLVSFGYANQGLKLEYCFNEGFNPSCGVNQAVILQSASYGRMRLGRCLDEDFGHLGCSADVLSQMDQMCSGKQTCEVSFPGIIAQPNCTIPKSLSQYLEAQFFCQRVLSVTAQTCTITLKSGKQSALSSAISGKECGSEQKPITIQAKEGQKINISLIDFNWNKLHMNVKGCVERYGYFIDSNKAVDICGKTSREKHLMLSESSVLQWALSRANSNFMATFEVIGCPTFEPPKDTWTKEDNDVVTVGCVHSDKTWRMRCIGNHWIGIQGKCEKEKKILQKLEVHHESNDSVFGLPPVVGFSLMASIFLIIICVSVTIIIGIFCIKKHNSNSKECYLAPVQIQQHQQSGTVHRSQYPTVVRGTLQTAQNQGLMAPGGIVGDNPNNPSCVPHYFILDGGESQKEPIYDAVYQNVDVN